MKGEDPKQKNKARVFNAPLGSAKSGRLVFTTHATGVTLLAGPSLQGLVRGHFVSRVSWVGFEEGIVMVGYYPGSSFLPDVLSPSSVSPSSVSPSSVSPSSVSPSSDRSPIPPLNRHGGPAEPGDEITLNTSIPWEIEFRGDIANLNADLRGLDLRSLDLLGGASRISLLLSRPDKTTFIYITGGVHDGAIRVPPGVGVRAQVSGGVRNLVFDGKRFAAIGGDINLENSTFKSATSRCEICITGSASNLTIEEQASSWE